MATAPIAPAFPDLHLVFNWDEGDLCLLTVYSYSEADAKPETRVSIGYYRGFQKKPSLPPRAFGTRGIDPNLDLSNCSAAEAKNILVTPKSLVKEIEDSIAGIAPEAHFQEFAFNVNLKGVNPTAYTRDDVVVQSRGDFKQPKVTGSRNSGSKGAVPDAYSGQPQMATPFQQLYGDRSPAKAGVHIIKGRERGPRLKGKDAAPWWILDQDRFNDFIQRLRDEKDSVELIDSESGQRIHTFQSVKSVELDHTILREFYLLGSEDQDIFTDYGDEFAREEARQRRTTSVAAVKKRRQRLVEKGDSIYGAVKPNVVPISQPRPQAPTTKRKFVGLAGRY